MILSAPEHGELLILPDRPEDIEKMRADLDWFRKENARLNDWIQILNKELSRMEVD